MAGSIALDRGFLGGVESAQKIEIAQKISKRTIAAAAIAGVLGYGLSNHQAIQVPSGAGFRSRVSLLDSEPRAPAPTQSGPMSVTEFPNECAGSASL